MRSHFFTKLETSGPHEVLSWTRKFDVFKKKFIFFPIHSVMHWSLAIFVNPQAGNKSLSREEKVAKSFLLHLDSMRGQHDKQYIKTHIVEWVNALLSSTSSEEHDIPICAPQGTS